jgi:hypothetical protein
MNRSAVPVAHRDLIEMGAAGPCALGEAHCIRYDVTAVMPAEQEDGLHLCEDHASRYLIATVRSAGTPQKASSAFWHSSWPIRTRLALARRV